YSPAWIGRVPMLRSVFRLLPYLLALWRVAGSCGVMHVMANSGWSWHLFAVPAIWIGRMRGVPVVVNYRGGEAGEFLARSHGAVRASMSHVAKLIVPSAFLQGVFGRFDMQAEIVPNVVDLARFRAREARHTDSQHLVVARNLEPIYDNETALRAFLAVQKRFPQARLTIAGTGPEEASLRALAAALGIADAVRFAGRLDRDAMAALYREADLTLNASLADNMPNSVLESLASGVPVVSTNVGGVPFLLQDEVTALLVPPADPVAMGAACVRLLEDGALWSRLAEAGSAEVQRYTWARVAPLLSKAYGSAMQQAKR
ncbi:MAG TPA: glycosyltransferase family 4 protein, partial [Ramlibacter sp.]|nr:glycosyltransferase family 4 protein [Ramlibacter sp.]